MSLIIDELTAKNNEAEFTKYPSAISYSFSPHFYLHTEKRMYRTKQHILLLQIFVYFFQAFLPASDHYTLDRYSPVRVSIFSTSPVSQNSGTITVAPVSTVAGFVAP